MDMLHERLADLAGEAPTGGAPPAELWARGRRAHRLRGVAVAAAVLVVGAVGTGIGVGLADAEDRGDGFDPAPAVNVNVSLPIEYPVGGELPELGNAPGPLAALWVTPDGGGGATEVVGLDAETGAFGTLPIDVLVDVSDFHSAAANPGVALSPDGRRIAYATPQHDVVVHDLVSGEKEYPTIENKILVAYGWLDATHLYGIAGSALGGVWNDGVGWVWEPGTAAELVSLLEYPGQPYLGFGWPYVGTDLMGGSVGRQVCAEPPTLFEVVPDDPQGLAFEVPVLCDIVGVVGSQIVLGHWNPEHVAGKSTAPKHPKGTVVALDIDGADRPYWDPAVPRGPDADRAFEDPARRHVVVSAGAPHRVAFATDLIGAALESAGGAS